MTETEKLINKIQHELKEAAEDLEDARIGQENAVGDVLAGDFHGAIARATSVAFLLNDAKEKEEKASKLLVKLIPQMRKDGFAEEIIFAVVETLIAQFLGA